MRKTACRFVLLIFLMASSVLLTACDTGNVGISTKNAETDSPEIGEDMMKAVQKTLDAYFSYRESLFSEQPGEMAFSATPNVLENLKIRSKELAGWEQITGAHFSNVIVSYEITGASESGVNSIEVIVYEKSTVPYYYDTEEPKDVAGWGMEHWITLQGPVLENGQLMIVTDFYDDNMLWIINQMLE